MITSLSFLNAVISQSPAGRLTGLTGRESQDIISLLPRGIPNQVGNDKLVLDICLHKLWFNYYEI